MDFLKTCDWPKQCSLLRSIFLSFVGLWIKTGSRKKSADSKLNAVPVQSSRSKSTTCPRKGIQLTFQSKSTATSDGHAQNFGNNVWLRLWLWHETESIANKVFSQIGHKWNAVLESQVESCIAWTSFDFRFEDFFSNLLFKIVIYCVTDQASITWSRTAL